MRFELAGQQTLLEEVLAGEPLQEGDAAWLLEHGDPLLLGVAADRLRQREKGDTVTFVVDRNINYTNICTSKCRFCAFYREESSPEAYILDRWQLLEKVGEAVRMGATQILLQGGLHPGLGIEFYEEMLKAIKRRYRRVHLHSFSPPEIIHISRLERVGVRETLERLKLAGLDSIPGGGAEILVDRVRKRVSPRKISWQEWMRVMREAHSLGIPTTATMVFGLGETTGERVAHLHRLRELQEKTNGFTAFIPWSFQPRNTRLEGEEASGIEYLKIIAVSRLFLRDWNIQVSWVTQGHKLAQVALTYGANDYGGTMLEENVVRAAGVSFHTTPPAEMIRQIRRLGRLPAKRDTLYNILERY